MPRADLLDRVRSAPPRSRISEDRGNARPPSRLSPNNAVEPQSTPSTQKKNPKDLKGSGGMSPVGANTIRDRRPRANPSVSSPFALFASFAVKNPG